MAPYPLVVLVTDQQPGWRLGTIRVLPRGFRVDVHRPGGPLGDGTWIDFGGVSSTDPAMAALLGDPLARPWLRLEIACSDDQPPRCIAMHAPDGIGTRELRFPLAGIVATAAASVASSDGTFLDTPIGAEYDDMVAEVGFAQKRDRKRRPLTDDRLLEVAEIVSQHPHNSTAAVQARLNYSRGYARRLIKQAEAKGLL
jgi:hypothetical protein